jgi:uncharacterized protein (TIGR03083 family)
MPEDANTQTTLALLRSSVARLRRIVEPLDDASVDQPAFPAEWSIAQVLSHLGSGAEIMQRRLDDTVNGRETPESFAPSVWDAWNAKSSRAQVDDALAADAALLARLEAVATSGAAELEFPMGPLTMDFATFVGMRVNEHTMHTWDVEVALAPEVPLPADAVPFVVDHLELIARYTGRPTGDERIVRVETTDPTRRFVVELATDAVAFSSGGDGPADLTLPAEAWARLVYGRLDADHTPAAVRDPEAALVVLRRVYPGP